MKKDITWQLFLAAGLIALSAVLYYIHFLIFGDARHIFIYLLGDIAFIPIEVLLVTIIIHQLLTFREKRERLDKMNMVIGVFFSELGTQLLSDLSKLDRCVEDIKNRLQFSADQPAKEFDSIRSYLSSHSYEVTVKSEDLENLKHYLTTKKDFMLRLLENPNLLEHESFTNLLRAVFHFTEELMSRKSLHGLPAKDLEHISNDIKRAYTLLANEWVSYMKHLKENYPFLFSLAVRTNPFDLSASVVIK